MIGNSTLLFVLDESEGENELININDMLDPTGKYSQELESTFKCIDYSPPSKLIENILMNS